MFDLSKALSGSFRSRPYPSPLTSFVTLMHSTAPFSTTFKSAMVPWPEVGDLRSNLALPRLSEGVISSSEFTHIISEELEFTDIPNSNTMVKRSVPASRLKVIKLEEGLGWDQVCRYLGHEIPEVEYPSHNVPNEVMAILSECMRPGLQKAKIVLAIGALTALAIGVWFVSE